MKFVVVFNVFAVTCTQVFGYPAEINLGAQDSMFELKLPRAVNENLEIQIYGTLNTEYDRLTVILPERDGANHCRITHDFKQNLINVSPAPPDTKESQEYSIVTENNEAEFTLTLKAKLVGKNQMFAVTYEAIDNGSVTDLYCYVHFDDLGYIVFEEGMPRLHSILFKFQ